MPSQFPSSEGFDIFRPEPSIGRRRNNPSPILQKIEKRQGELVDLDSVRLFQRSSLAPSSRRAMAAHWSAFTAWCASHAYQALPANPLVIATYLAFAANIVRPNGDWAYAPTTLSAWLCSINKAHFLAGWPQPGQHADVTMAIEGIRREHPRPVVRRAPLLIEELHRIIPMIAIDSRPGGVIGHWDCAILLLGFSGSSS